MKFLNSLIVGVNLYFLTGCEAVEILINTGIENLKLEQELPLCQLNQESFTELTCGQQTYTILPETIDLKEIGDPFAKVSMSVTLNDNKEILGPEELRKIDWMGKEEERNHLTFGWIHLIKDQPSNEVMTININQHYYLVQLNQ